ncbi:DNA ligase [Aliikangiella sp. IMCC44359]|uniref:DNA ligase n=1 Tax=Aliikangiella sp. IMCC44359 TaxID=3459125 RepID=UPI00403B37D7
MLKIKKSIGFSLCLLPIYWPQTQATVPLETSIPPLLLAKNYQSDIQLDQYWASEKLDGVRAFWDGKNLITRGGHRINSPSWFTENFPKQALDGELWINRGEFEMVSGLVRQHQPDEQKWRKVKYKVFDLPLSLEKFENRYIQLKQLLRTHRSPSLHLVQQININSSVELKELLTTTIAKGGEGLMLHRKASLYQAKRSNDLQKLKPFDDAEATVIRHITGKGKYKDLLGSIEVINKEGVVFKIGSGFSLEDRRFPPPVNSVITYRYRGKTKNNTPRFATYLRRAINLED